MENGGLLMLRQRYEHLEDLIKQHSYTSFAEIGAQSGVTSKHVIEHCPSLEKVILVDPIYNPIYADFFKKTTVATFIQKTSVKASLEVEDNSFDIIYIDADHTYEHCLEDIQLWKPKVKKGGILCGHDYFISGVLWPGVKKAVDESFSSGVNLLLEPVLYNLPEPEDCVWWIYV
jgi:predicted O-methyltransferase YrrM